ncbi:MAG: hypothetical protein ABSF45_29930 [Terriglobia bacterium]
MRNQGGRQAVPLRRNRVATVTAILTAGFSFDDEPTVNSKDELAVATSA